MLFPRRWLMRLRGTSVQDSSPVANAADAPSAVPRVDEQAKFRKALSSTGTATTEVSTDPRVFERITLGLYREPSSAIRELISNAYDADAQNVTVKTNPPYFDRIVVMDDGMGMSPTAIDHIVHHVGGSLKRTSSGQAAGVIKSVGTSPKGRKLIGQMGIGLFSVARLTRHFLIETKQAGDDHHIRLEMDLTGLDPAVVQAEGAERYVAGYAKVSRQTIAHHSEQKKSYTRITLFDILPEAKRILQSVDRWDNFKANLHARKGELKYHIGRLDPIMQPNPPWDSKDKTPLSRFKAMVDALATPAEASGSSPSLDQTLDYYLAMIWRISLSAPLGYVGEHPFALTGKDDVDFYSLEGDGTPELIELGEDEKIGDRLDLHPESASLPFKVVIDEVELRRPIIFRGFQMDARKLLPRPKMLVGKFASTSDGASLDGTAYFFWSYETIPKENNGILVRVAGASGTLFDRTFLGFRTSENLRLRQVSSEAFVSNGLDRALNIDRESFVDSDPNVRALQRWVFRSMTRLFTRLKMDQRNLGAERKERSEAEEARETEAVGAKIWSQRRGTPRSKPPQVVVSSRASAPADVKKDAIFIGGIKSEKRGGVEKEQIFSARLRAAILVLDGWGLLDGLSDEERSNLVEDLAKVIDRRA
jgi:hypothetical protein